MAGQARTGRDPSPGVNLKVVKLRSSASFQVHQPRHRRWRDQSPSLCSALTCCATPSRSLNVSEPQLSLHEETIIAPTGLSLHKGYHNSRPQKALEKEMATHSSVLAWRIPETGEPGGLPSMGSHRVGHD